MSQPSLVSRAEHLMGQPIDHSESLVPTERRHRVLRCRFQHITAVVKDAGHVEIDAYRRLETSEVTPKVLAHGPGTIVLEDLSGPRLDTVLEHGGRDAARTALSQLASALGTVHRLTLDTSPPVATAAEDERPAITAFRQVCRRLGVAADFEPFEPGPPQCMTQLDVGPDNCIVTPSGLRLIDFELATTDSPYLDSAHWHLGFPCCGCGGGLPPSLVAELDSIHLAVLGREPTPGARERARAVLLCDRIARYVEWDVLDEAWVWGRIAGRRRMLALTSRFDDGGHLPDFSETVKRLEHELRRRWPEVGDSLPVYQALA